MGNQKYKTRTLARTTAPKWIEQFDFYLYDGQPQILEVQVYDESFSKDYIGRCAIDIGLLEKEMTHQKTFQLQESSGEISMLLTVSGTSGAESISDLGNYTHSEEEESKLKGRFVSRHGIYLQSYWFHISETKCEINYTFSVAPFQKITKSLNSVKDVGHLTVKVFEAQGLAAADIGGKSDPFCVLEIVNSRLQVSWWTHYHYCTHFKTKWSDLIFKNPFSLMNMRVFRHKPSTERWHQSGIKFSRLKWKTPLQC